MYSFSLLVSSNSNKSLSCKESSSSLIMGLTLKSTRKFLGKHSGKKDPRRGKGDDGDHDDRIRKDHQSGKNVVTRNSDGKTIINNNTSNRTGLTSRTSSYNNNTTSSSSSRPSLMNNFSKGSSSLLRSNSAKRLLNSFSNMASNVARGAGGGGGDRNHHSSSATTLTHSSRSRHNARRSSIDTAKISSIDFQSARLYPNDSDIEDYSHSSVSESCHTITSSSQQCNNLSRRRTSTGLYSSMSPPVRIVEGNSSEEFSSGSMRKLTRNSKTITTTATSCPTSSNKNIQQRSIEGDDLQDYVMAEPSSSLSPSNNTSSPLQSDEETAFDHHQDVTERQSNISDQIIIAAVSGIEKVADEDSTLPIHPPPPHHLTPTISNKKNSTCSSKNDGQPTPSSTNSKRRSLSKRASGSSDDLSNISDIDIDENDGNDSCDEEDEGSDRYGVDLPTFERTNSCASAFDNIQHQLQFVPYDLRADYLLVYEFLQEEALRASIQDESMRTKVRSERLLRSNSTRKDLDEESEKN